MTQHRSRLELDRLPMAASTILIAMLELRHLRYFIAVAEELNFSRAAERLHMAQPPLSVAIRQLEQELGTDLFLRTTREVQLTDAGQAFLDGARRTLTELEHAESDAKRTAAGELGRLSVAFSWSARFEILPELGQAFRTNHPDVELRTEQMWNAKMPQALLSGEIDVAISLCPERVSECSYLTIRREPVAVVLAEAHPLAAAESTPLEALAAEQFLMFPRDLAPRLYDFMLGLCRRAGFEPQRVIPHRRGDSDPGRGHSRGSRTRLPRAQPSRWNRRGSHRRPAGPTRDGAHLAERRQLRRRGGVSRRCPLDVRGWRTEPRLTHRGLIE